MNEFAALQNYVEQHFVSLEHLAELAGVPVPQVTSLIAARAIPGPIYSLWPNGAFSSPIGGRHGPEPRGAAEHWYSPAAAWWLRRSIGMSPHEAAAAFEARFVADFVKRLAVEPAGSIGYPQTYRAGRFDRAMAIPRAQAEWKDWLDGGYGVCLRQANAHHAIVKTCRRATIVALTEENTVETLTIEQRNQLLDALEELDAVMLPFAPHQRPHGTPGLWLDATLRRYHLGTTREFQHTSTAQANERFCA